MIPAEPTDYVDMTRLAKRLGVCTKTAKKLARAPGFPQPDPLCGRKRYWPAVVAFLHKRHGLTVEVADDPPDGQENFDAKPPPRHLRRPWPAMARTR